MEDTAKRTALKNFGCNFGIAFQIIDDALDYSANPEKFGKAIGDDFREGKVTLPVIYAYSKSGAVDKQFWQKVLGAGYSASVAELGQARDLITGTGAFDAAVAMAKKYAIQARAELDIFPDSAIKAALLHVVQSSVIREF